MRLSNGFYIRSREVKKKKNGVAIDLHACIYFLYNLKKKLDLYN